MKNFLLLLVLLSFVLTFAGCAKAPKLNVTLSLEKQNANLIFVKVKVINTEDRATVPIAIEVTGQAENNGQWDKSSTLLHPAAFVLNKKEQREITKLWRVPADSRASHPDRQRTGTWVLVKNRTRGKSLYPSGQYGANYNKALSSVRGSPCDSATPGCVMCPAYVFTPTRIAALSRQACSSPLAHNSAR